MTSAHIGALRQQLDTVASQLESLQHRVSFRISEPPSVGVGEEPACHRVSPEAMADLYEFYALQPVTRLRVVDLVDIDTQTELCAFANRILREYAVRTAHRARKLMLAPLGLAYMPSIVRLRQLYERTFHEVRNAFERPLSNTPHELRAFDNVIRRVFDRHISVSNLLSLSIVEFAKQKRWESSEGASTQSSEADAALWVFRNYSQLEDFFVEFVTERVSLRLLIRHYLYLSEKVLALSPLVCAADSFEHDEAQCSGAFCKQTNVLTLAKMAVRNVQAEVADAPPIELLMHGDMSHTLFGVNAYIYGIIHTLLSEAVESTVAHYSRVPQLPPPRAAIRVLVSQSSSQQDAVVRVSDACGGCAVELLDETMSYVSYVRCHRHLVRSGEAAGHNEVGFSWERSALRLPYARTAARCLGGDVAVASVEGVGFDRTFCFPSRAGDFSNRLL